MTTASLSCASARKLRPFSGSCTTSRFSMTSLISAVVVCSSGAVGCDDDLLGEPLDAERELEAQRAADLEHDAVLRLRREAGQRRGDLPLRRCEAPEGRTAPRRRSTRSTTVPLAGCVAVTVAPGSTPPELSLTTPPISPVFVCPPAAGARGEGDDHENVRPRSKRLSGNNMLLACYSNVTYATFSTKSS